MLGGFQMGVPPVGDSSISTDFRECRVAATSKEVHYRIDQDRRPMLPGYRCGIRAMGQPYTSDFSGVTCEGCRECPSPRGSHWFVLRWLFGRIYEWCDCGARYPRKEGVRGFER